jgi:hypothetical protein
MAMDAACNVLYLDRSARQERMVRRGEAIAEEARTGDDDEEKEGARRLQVNVQTLLETFSKGKFGGGCGGRGPSVLCDV